mmetsp:Transcript_7524/g.18512  ORF Transcript_7524/g.18512 Transcript_7524/m.18512 type:complete len:464 (-) Transcript_7524:372-1763(-)|eukprot:CAMPEP_0197180162 /NCGR_PEP_ID=MMETSP1423-20130617/4861_1 /TAXON_ID=476441 /ORGANISM="Pseudo-nitzschia heimii, Strain UNC1101" /LENGTH=463 /DNA_ID=CAMNT_0042630189 /DNA_START=129 /DNA_END=1520 /DNA_ORIENTATION=-
MADTGDDKNTDDVFSATDAFAAATTGSINLLEAKPLDRTSAVSAKPHIPSVSASAVLGESSSMPEGTPVCRGMEFEGRNSTSNDDDVLSDMMAAFRTTGFQATNLALAIERIREMRSWRLSDVPYKEGVDDPALEPIEVRRRLRARIFLSYTSNQISCGQREVLRFLVRHKMVDCVVTTAGGIEEDVMKCLQPTYMGDFKLDGRSLRKKGINRIGNLLVPNKNYCQFEDWISPIIETMHDEQDAEDRKWAEAVAKGRPLTEMSRFAWTPSAFIRRLGLEIDHDESLLCWAARNDIPVYCPALTDGSVGDMLYFHSYKRPGFVLDIAGDIRGINDSAVRSHATGMILLGGGLIKHHTCNANLMRNGADWSVYVNTGQEYDGSDSGASPDEAISWGKIRITARPVKVTCDATIAFPLIVSQTFAKDVDEWKASTANTACFVDDLPPLDPAAADEDDDDEKPHKAG